MPEPKGGEMSRYAFQVAYEGAPDTHSMDVQQLAPALLGFGKLIREANAEINGQKTQVKVLVTSDFEHKCFNINFEILQSLLQKLDSLFGEAKLLSAKEIMEWISGISIISGVSVIGLLEYLKRKKGRKVVATRELRDEGAAGVVAVKIEGEHHEIHVHNHVYRLSENRNVLSAVQQTIAPIGSDGIERVEFRERDRATSSYDRSSARDIALSCDIPPGEESAIKPEPEPVPDQVTAYLRVYSPVFDERAKMWRFRYGDEHIYADISETSIAKDAIKRGGSFIDDLYKVKMEITQHITDGKHAQTIGAMAEGADVIYQAALFDVPWLGYADFLVRVHRKTRLGKYGYEVVDTKLARTAQPKHVVQLCIYSKLLARVQEQLPESVHLVMGDASQASWPLSHFLHYAELSQRRIETFAAAPPQGSFGEPCGHCGLCRWQDHCSGEWERVDHLSLVANITRNQIAKLNAAEINTVHKLAGIPDGAGIPTLQEETLARLRQQARLQVIKRDTGVDRYELLDPCPGKGFARMPKPDPGDLFFDMEGDPLAEGGLEYLFGFAYSEGGSNRFKAFWAHSRGEERHAFEKAMDFVVQRLADHPNAHIYHYAAYEETALKRLSVLHGTREAELDNLLRQRKLVDLYKVVREGIRVSEPRYSIKNLETFYMGKRAGDVSSGGESIVVYEQWRELGDPALLKQIEDYNATDCHSTLLLRVWLLSLRPRGIPWFTAPQFDDDDAKREETLSEAEQRLQSTTGRLLDNVPEQERPYRELVSQLLEFHRREAKPQWWAMFNRQELSEEELIDDADCIGGLRRDPGRQPEADKRSLIHTLRFPPQDYKLRIGDTPLIAESLARAGEIVDLDEERLTISLRIGNKAPPFPKAFSLIPGGPIDTTVLREAVYRYAEAVIAGGRRYRAITALLGKTPPSVTGVKPGQPIIDGSTTVDGAVRAVCDLRNSYMLVQGPPGAGKTFTASHAIVALLAQGKRVGVSSNSHKAINTLLAEVEALATKRKVKFRGVKKCSDDDHRFSGRFIEDVADNETAISGEYALVAGTAWLFAREELDQKLDYVFIDEAGQVSLANVIAIGVSARNIVLIGDQMQLAQPTQGVHPGESGRSALEYTLGDRATVPPELGIFLDKTRRMHPDVCRFVSDAFYDGRLLPDRTNERQQLLLRANADPALAPTGLRFIDVEHQDCGQSSEEETNRLDKVYRSLLKQRWTDSQGREAPVGTDDILVVSPYNMQVDLLRRALPNGARVGTVDKFQGQQAAVVLVSMATSSAEDMPRNIEFLFSRNRLNVAISRARCLAVMFANPRLLETPCSSIEQMRLVNTLCWAKAYAEA